MNATYYLQGPGSLNDAVFELRGNQPMVHVTAEVGMTGCYDDTLTVAEATVVWRQLVDAGWHRVAQPRRSARQISDAIRG
jgi:hypothetical protein